jgi:legumain
MEDTDEAKMNKETLQDQYNTVKKETSKSHVLQWGDVKFTDETLDNFESGNAANKKTKFWSQVGHIGKNLLKDIVKWDEASAMDKVEASVDSRDIKMHYLYNKVTAEPSMDNMNALQAELKFRAHVDATMDKLFPVHFAAAEANNTPLPTDFDCLRDIIDKYEQSCHKLEDYSLKWVKLMVAECEGMKSFPAAREETLNRI